MSNVLITGTSSGIGLQAAVELARRGTRVFASMRDLSRSGPLQESAERAAVDVEIIQLDVNDPASVARGIEEVQTSAGSIDVIVNNAAIVGCGPLEFRSESETLNVFDTNVFGPLRVVRAALPSMRARGSGRIVNISSCASHGRLGHRLLGLYSASKSALTTLTEELCKELAPLGIEVVLMEGAVGGHSTMTRGLATVAADLDPDASPYKVVERAFQLQWPPLPWANDAISRTANAIADAATIPNPPFIYPPKGQDWLKPVRNLPDDVFLRLCAMDPAPELYTKASIFWGVNGSAMTGEPSPRT